MKICDLSEKYLSKCNVRMIDEKSSDISVTPYFSKFISHTTREDTKCNTSHEIMTKKVVGIF
jgi:hypothetical protein